MKLACLAKAMLFGSVLMLPLGCNGGGSEETGAETEADLSDAQQRERAGYGDTGRYGPGGQDKPGETGGGKTEDGKADDGEDKGGE